MRYVALLMCAGCMLPSMNQEGLQLVVNDLTTTQEQLKTVAVGLNRVTEVLNTLQEPTPNLAPLMTETTDALAAASESLTEAGKTAVTLQSGIGVPERSLDLTPEQKAMWRARYIALAKLFEKVKIWAKSRIPGASRLTSRHPRPWSGTDIAALLAAITTGAAALGIGGKTANRWRKGANDAEGLAATLKTKCNGDFAGIMTSYPTTVQRHRIRKANEI